ncbi:putative calcium/proton exchanger [Colletotrichum sublineola]|uniref:Putative calcium/proton exchanger n=1 Tax=Colletotrichum sublineola TaxID=1173701 RepID=A0A066XNL1_COLSU|nr:putative calcium/proton exchanger [Colletotrichum sublineola]
MSYDHGNVNENSLLLVNGNHETHVANSDSGNKTLKFLFNSTHTPGTDSPNIASLTDYVNFLLVMVPLGMCFFFSGIVNIRDRVTSQGIEQSFASTTTQTTCSLITLSSASLVIPTTLYSVLNKADSVKKEHSILVLSRSTAIILLLLYVLYLCFQLRTHPNLFNTENQRRNEEEANKPV